MKLEKLHESSVLSPESVLQERVSQFKGLSVESTKFTVCSTCDVGNRVTHH
jgi:hypothetical protein